MQYAVKAYAAYTNRISLRGTGNLKKIVITALHFKCISSRESRREIAVGSIVAGVRSVGTGGAVGSPSSRAQVAILSPAESAAERGTLPLCQVRYYLVLQCQVHPLHSHIPIPTHSPVQIVRSLVIR